MEQSNFNIHDYDDIRPYLDEEIKEALRKLIADPEVAVILPHLFPDKSHEQLENIVEHIDSIHDFKEKIGVEVMQNLRDQTTFSLTSSGRSQLDANKCYTFISNHRDIVLDSAFLNLVWYEAKQRFPRIAIGDNLMIRPWIKRLVRICDAFIVKRAPSVREMLMESGKLSSYIRHTIEAGEESVWIAQREGRAKTSNDLTQPAILKMLSMSHKNDVEEAIERLNIVPMTISYEFDPCDYLKAQELMMKRDNPQFKKSQADDFINMQTGIKGYKGRVHIAFSSPITNVDKIIAKATNKQEVFALIAEEIDRKIHLNYRLYPCNYVAFDLLHGGDRYKDMYSDRDRLKFETYLHDQIDKVTVPGKDKKFLKQTILEMYSNPLINHLKAKGELR